jgi:hypothetical protein
MRNATLSCALLIAAGIASAQQPPATLSREWYQQFSGSYSALVEPFRIVGNIH